MAMKGRLSITLPPTPTSRSSIHHRKDGKRSSTATPFAGGRRGGFVRGSEGGQRAAADQVNIAQVIVTSIISTAELGIVAIGLTMTFSILRFANFAHASMAVIGAYIAYTFNVQLDMSLWLAFAAAMLVMGSFGIVV